jgi:Calcineurin-like phosphoesterase
MLLVTHLAFAQQSLMTFSVMGDTPYSVTDARKLQHQLTTLNPKNEFVIHLGDIKTGITACSDSWYQQVADILAQSPKRLFIIPGDNEWNDCFDPEEAWALWTKHFLYFDTQWSNSLPVVRDPRHPENFAFTSNGVMCVGLNLVGGKVLDPIAWSVQDGDNIEWIETQLENSDVPISHLVIFGHSLPDRKHRTFFAILNRLAQSFEHPILYIHGDGHKWIKDYPFEAKNILRVEVEAGGRANPLTITVTDDPTEPFVLER